MVDTEDRNDIAARRKTRLAELGITLAALFVPQSMSRNADTKNERGKLIPSLNWKVTIARDGRSMTTDYMEGIGRVPGYRTRRVLADYDFDKCAETGRVHKTTMSGPVCLQVGYGRGEPLPQPKLEDVLWCLLGDADAVTDYAGFEDWAESLGYDTDSRKAESIWKACIESGQQLRRALGGRAILVELRELFQDF